MRGEVHNFLEKTLDFSKPVKFTVDIKKYVGEIIEDISVGLNNYKS